ncbi:ficolin-1-like [Pomacea canaliculata]|uniref:ficolin-1-like n=1 Tax=Pomacea canaliculata TaxID=400727 RepID=UPI000D725DBA|nr:ficolin-1-like [Pomacea canaliculata]
MIEFQCFQGNEVVCHGQVFQRRRDGSVDFYRDWAQYEQGFGDIRWEFWLGLSRLHTLTKGRPTRLRVDLGEKNGHRHYAEYSSFRVDGPETNYALTVSGYSGNAGDSMEDHNYQEFSTYDRDNDKDSRNCAAVYYGAWWYFACHYAHLNGLYKADGAKDYDASLVSHPQRLEELHLQRDELKPA